MVPKIEVCLQKLQNSTDCVYHFKWSYTKTLHIHAICTVSYSYACMCLHIQCLTKYLWGSMVAAQIYLIMMFSVKTSKHANSTANQQVLLAWIHCGVISRCITHANGSAAEEVPDCPVWMEPTFWPCTFLCWLRSCLENIKKLNEENPQRIDTSANTNSALNPNCDPQAATTMTLFEFDVATCNQ